MDFPDVFLINGVTHNLSDVITAVHEIAIKFTLLQRNFFNYYLLPRFLFFKIVLNIPNIKNRFAILEIANNMHPNFYIYIGKKHILICIFTIFLSK